MHTDNIPHILYFSLTDAYIVKLFDRSVDLSPYNESSSLYPIARSWMRNTANDQYIEQPPTVPQMVSSAPCNIFFEVGLVLHSACALMSPPFVVLSYLVYDEGRVVV